MPKKKTGAGKAAAQPAPAPGLYLPAASKADASQGALALPAMLCPPSRSGSRELDPLLAGLTVETTYTLGPATRGGTPPGEQSVTGEGNRVLALEAEDGTTLFIHADTLCADIARRRPEAVVGGQVDLARFRDLNAVSRGLGDVLWKAVSVLRLPEDGLAEQAHELAREWAVVQGLEKLQEQAFDTASYLGAKALMWKIEAKLAGRPGLYCWQDKTIAASDRCLPGDRRLDKAAAGEPMLLLLHGTGSHTVGGFADLRADEATWKALQTRFPGGIFGYEHRTFSQSPLENAVEVLETLPGGACLSLLSHSRGGLVGDLLCLGQADSSAIDGFRFDTAGSDDPAGLEREAAEERKRLRRISQLLADRRITVDRYVRVAAPARGTRFLSDHLDAALSDFLTLMQWGGGAAVGAVAAALGGPAAGEALGGGASSAIGVVKRLVLEIAGRRIDPRLIPGLAAMRIDSPLAAFLAHPGTRRRDGIAMAVIAGDTEFSGFGVSSLGRRVANLFCDWRLFDRQDNDLVVDTDSMYAGLGFKAGARYLYDRGESVSHFRYFANPLTRDALRGWLVDEPAQVPQFQALTDGSKRPWEEFEARRATRGAPGQALPVVILLPGIMGSHLAVREGKDDSDRIWFNFLRLGFGQLDRIESITDPSVFAQAIWERFYGDLADYLADSHEVIPFPYDWRRSIEDAAAGLEGCIDKALARYPGQPIRLLAHSMGGLVARTLMTRHADCWQKVVASGGRLLMLGTPNNGAHLMAHTLLGKTDSMRGLEKLDGKHDLQQVLDIVAGFPGALSLLPRPGLADAGSEPRIPPARYYNPATWQSLKARNTDHWYGNQIAAVPAAATLQIAHSFWQTTLPDNTVANPDRVSYVFGQGEKTPCGVAETAAGRLQLLFTGEGDGSVTWASGRLDNLPENERCWYLPAEHSDLTGEAEYFPAIVELLATGSTSKLERLPRSRGTASRSFVLDAAPPVVPSEDELARAVFGSQPRRRPSRAKATLKVGVRAGDLRFIDQPVICGHYLGDPIAAAEAILDNALDGRLSERERLGVYAGEVGTSAIILPPPNAGQNARGSRPGAIVVGLGEFNGQLGTRQITDTVRAAVLRFLLLQRDTGPTGDDAPIQLCSLLLGCNSNASIDADESVAAVTCGVLEANRQFVEAVRKTDPAAAGVSTLTFIELYRDMAITAARAVAALPHSLEANLKRLGAQLAPQRELTAGKGVRERLSAEGGAGYWSRLIVTDAGATDTPGVPGSNGQDNDPAAGAANPVDQPAATPPPESRQLPERLKYVYLSQRARAEAVVQQRQPGLIEAIVKRQRLTNTPNPELGRTLFQLLVPRGYKAAARERSRLLLILDSYTASLPWELLEADGEPLVTRTPMIRQLITQRFRAAVPTANTNSACVIVAPSTDGFNRRFGGSAESLAELSGAIAEGRAIREQLRAVSWDDDKIVFSPDGSEAIDVFAALYRRPYRLLAICGHGIFETRGLDGRSYSGVVLSDGLLITAVEIGLMEVVPEVVFLSCCHLGSMSHDGAQPNRLAYSLARELIDIGVRCVVAAGWAVDDSAASTFATTFFAGLTTGQTYGEAIFAARVATYDRHPGSNTWGAYQAYGDPAYRLGPRQDRGQEQERRYYAVEELLDSLDNRRISYSTRTTGNRPEFDAEASWLRNELARCPPGWANRPDVWQARGALCAELGDKGFAAAREAYLASLQREDRTGRVACRTVEQLANLEARQGRRLAEEGDCDAGLKLVEGAIARLDALERAVQDITPVSNPERAALLGSALKIKAAILAQAQAPAWKAIGTVLGKAAAAYAQAGNGYSPDHPYPTLNALPLAWLAGTLPRSIDGPRLARRCAEEASRRFADSKDFWDAAGRPDGFLAAWLLADKTTDEGGELAAAYRQLAADVPGSGREWDSVARQLKMLARFLETRKHQGDPERAAVLTHLAELNPWAPARSGNQPD